MRLGQIRFGNTLTAALFEGGMARPIPDYRITELIRKAETESVPLTELVMQMASHHPEPRPPALPICPVEVWASSCTYGPAAGPGESGLGGQESLYTRVCNEPRPAIYFKGTARVCVGPGQSIGIRADSRHTVPQPELALVLGSKGRILGFTLANDVSARDIERDNPFYMPQSKIYQASCSLGPVIVTADELKNPYELEMTCVITRAGKTLFSGSISTGCLQRKFEDLVGYLLRSNPVPAGSVLLTGTGIIPADDAALQEGDVVTVRVPEIGELANAAVVIP